MRALRDALIEAGAWCTTAPAGEPSPADIALAWIAGAIVAYAALKALRHTLWPGERDPDHIKRRVLHEEEPH